MAPFNPAEHPHRRYNPLADRWVLVSPHRTQRPWQGARDAVPVDARPRHDPECYLCPRNGRAGGAVNPDYDATFVFTNDFAALLPDAPAPAGDADALFRVEGVRGTSRVICFSPRHDLTLPELPLPAIRRVIDVWAEQTTDLGATYRWVQVFENKGAMMGASNPHPHGQVWAEDALPDEAAAEDRAQRAYHASQGRPLLIDVAQAEAECGKRVVVENDAWLAIVPFWAVWPFETLLLPRTQVRRLPDLDAGQREALADILRRLLTRYDNLFEISFPYSMGWHGAPYDPGAHDHWTLHAHFYPPLLRSATVRKWMVGYELLAEAQRDITPESAAARLRDLPEAHYRQRRAP
jgi:UDPglucose--hexose-1-phosphate uridylyltransferase